MNTDPSLAVSSGGGRPKEYRTASGKRVPGVTTILGKFKDAGGLIHWAWQAGRDGKDYRDLKEDAGTAGHLAHAWIDDDIHGRPPRAVPPGTDLDVVALATEGYASFKAWRKGVVLQIIDTERPLVSELHGFGGTYDALGLVNDVLVLLDWKTGNRVYTEHVAQCAAYRQLIREHGRRDVQGARLLRVGKELGDFHDHYIPPSALDLGWERFLASKWLYETDAALRKAVGI